MLNKNETHNSSVDVRKEIALRARVTLKRREANRAKWMAERMRKLSVKRWHGVKQRERHT